MTLDKLLEQKDDPMRKRLQQQMLKVGVRESVNSKLELIKNDLKTKLKVDALQGELNEVYSSLLYDFSGKSQKALATRISESVKVINDTENRGEDFINSFKTK